MAKEIAISKIAKISQAQQYMLLAVLGASFFLGASISLTKHFVEQIMYNANYIAAEEQSIASYSDVIKKIGVCKAPKGNTYTKEEIVKCDPYTIDTNDIKGTLRYEVLEELVANKALSSVPKTENASCKNKETGESLTYKELKAEYDNATTQDARKVALKNIKTCSALRVIPDALPAFRNEEALLASLNSIFNLSGWVPEYISPADPSGAVEDDQMGTPEGLNPIDINLSIEADAGTTMNILNDIERSIREFDIKTATIEYDTATNLTMSARASSYYVEESSIKTKDVNVQAGGL